MFRHRQASHTGLAALAWTAALLGGGPVAGAQSAQPRSIMVTMENDLLSNPPGNHQDRHYTQGLKIVYFDGDHCLTNLSASLGRAIPLMGVSDPRHNVGFLFGQNIYTPEDLTLRHPDPLDRPYAGWLYIGLAFQRRGQAGVAAVQENFEVDVGIVGPASLGEQAQRITHEIRNFTLPQGWDDQLPNEPALLLRYKRTWRVSINENTARYVDVLPHVGGNLGNVNVSANAGIVERFGFGLPDDFGVPFIDSAAATTGERHPDAPAFSFYMFVGAEARVVGHNLFLDGSTFRGGPSVDKNPFVADLMGGGRAPDHASLLGKLYPHHSHPGI